MRKYSFIPAILLIVALLITGPLFAQTSRNASPSEGKSAFTNIAVTGLEERGVPGYIEMYDGAANIYYLYVSTGGKLLIASAALVGSGPLLGSTASPSITTWQNFGQLVGSQ